MLNHIHCFHIKTFAWLSRENCFNDKERTSLATTQYILNTFFFALAGLPKCLVECQFFNHSWVTLNLSGRGWLYEQWNGIWLIHLNRAFSVPVLVANVWFCPWVRIFRSWHVYFDMLYCGYSYLLHKHKLSSCPVYFLELSNTSMLDSIWLWKEYTLTYHIDDSSWRPSSQVIVSWEDNLLSIEHMAKW